MFPVCFEEICDLWCNLRNKLETQLRRQKWCQLAKECLAENANELPISLENLDIMSVETQSFAMPAVSAAQQQFEKKSQAKLDRTRSRKRDWWVHHDRMSCQHCHPVMFVHKSKVIPPPPAHPPPPPGNGVMPPPFQAGEERQKKYISWTSLLLRFHLVSWPNSIQLGTGACDHATAWPRSCSCCCAGLYGGASGRGGAGVCCGACASGPRCEHARHRAHGFPAMVGWGVGLALVGVMEIFGFKILRL